MRRVNVLFLCTANSSRSIIAEALLNELGGGRFRAYSAGSHPSAEVDRLAIETLARNGYATAGLRSKSWDAFAKPGAPRMDFVITVCDAAAGEACPVFPGAPVKAHWGVADPAAAQGSEDAKRAAFREALDLLRRRVQRFTSLPFESVDRRAMHGLVGEIARADVLPHESAALNELDERLRQVQHLLSRHRLVAAMVNRQESPKRKLVDSLVQKENLGQLAKLLNALDDADAARIIEALPAQDRLLAWEQVRPERLDRILLLLIDDVREELVNASGHQSDKAAVSVFELHDGRLAQVKVSSRAELNGTKPIWVDLVSPSAEARHWVGEHFGIDLPDPETLTDLESSARYFVEDNGEIHVHSDFLLISGAQARGVPVAFILFRDVLFSVRAEELPAFRLQRLRASTQPGYVNEGKDVLLDLYAADAEYSADSLEDVYRDLESIGKRVLDPEVTDDAAARILSGIARAEDLNGRIRRNVLDTRRALSFLSRSKLLAAEQAEQVREILRDIESLDAHTTFLFGKVNFLMDATVGFININQNKRVSKLTAVGIVFVPVNILAGIGGMSEFSALAERLHVPAALAYTGFVVICGLIGWATYALLIRGESPLIGAD